MKKITISLFISNSLKTHVYAVDYFYNLFLKAGYYFL